MKELSSADVDLLMSADSGLLRHCRRVAAVALEVARFSEIPIRLEPVLEHAALLHHSIDLVLDSNSLARLARDVQDAGSVQAAGWETSRLPALPRELIRVLSILHGQRAGGEPTLQLLAGIVRMCDLVDEQLEAQFLGYKDVDCILEEVRSMGVFEGFDASLVSLLQQARFPDLDLRLSGARQLPVQAQVAQEVFRRLVPAREYEIPELEGMAARDPVLAASLLGVANAALYSPATRIGTIRQAISYIGTTAARHIMMAAVLRPLFASASLSRMWTHCLNTAKFCAGLAEQTSLMDAEEASLLGLVHDIGALAVQFLATDALDGYSRLRERGCPPAYIEKLLFGRDHGELGAEILADWGFPEHMLEAVRFQHEPERSKAPLASLVYLAEFWAGLDEDIASAARLRECLSRTGVSLESLACAPARRHALSLLNAVA